MNINLSRFKKIDCDDHCTTLLHPSGHTIKIAHEKLSPEVRENLEAIPMHLAKGGFAKHSQKFDPNIKGNQAKGQPILPGHLRNESGKIVPAKASGPSASSNTMPGSPKRATQAYTEPDDQGTDVVLAALEREAPPFGPKGEPKYHSPPCINPSCKSFGKPHPNCRCYGGKMGMYGGYAEGGDVKSYCETKQPHQQGCEYFKDGGSTSKPMEQADTETAQPMGSPAPAVPDEQTQPDVAEQPQEPATNAAQDVAQEPPQEQAAQPETSQAQPEQQKTPVQEFEQHKQNELQELGPEYQAFQADVNSGQIKPQTYSDLFAKKDTLGKIGTLFGLLVGGVGSGLSGQPNALMEMMNKEIDRDLASQQHSVENKQNYLKINQQSTDSYTKAYALARTQMNYAALHSLVENTMKLPPGPQRDQAMKTLAIMNQSIDAHNFNILDKAATSSALSKVMFGGEGAGPDTTMMKSGLLGPEAKEVGADVESKTIPGVPGRASRPIQENDRKEIQAMNVLDNKVKDILSFAKAHKGTLSPSQRAVGAQKAEEMVNFYNNSIQGGILTQGRLDWLDKQIKKNPTSIFQDIMGNNSRLQEIQRSNSTRRDLLMKQYGYGGNEAPQGGAQPETKMMHGVQYKKVQGGWKRVQ